MAFFLIYVLLTIIFTIIGVNMARSRNRDTAVWGLICALTGFVGVIVLAIAGSAPVQSASYDPRRTDDRTPTLPSPPRAIAPPVAKKSYDEAKWAALLEVDSDISAAAEKLKHFDPKYQDELAEKFFVLGDKAYLGTLVEKITARAELELQQEADRRVAESQALADEGNQVYFQYLRILKENEGIDPDYYLKVAKVDKYEGPAKAFRGGLKITFDDGSFALKGSFMKRKFDSEKEMESWS
jgi:hypothetical protein